MRYTNLQIGVIIAALIVSIIIGACVPVLAGELDARAQDIDNRTVVVEYVGDSAGGFKVNAWRIVDLQYMNVCYLSDGLVCIPMR